MTPLRRLPPSIAIGLALIGLLGCGGGRAPGPASPPDTSATRPETTAVAPPPDTLPRPARYRVARIPNRRALKALWKELGAARFLLALEVNRRDSLHVRDGDSLVVPADTAAGLLDLAPFPHALPGQRDRGKLLLVERRVQAWAAYEGERLVRWGPTSTGRESLPTPEGLYHTNWKDAERTSTFNDEWLLKWYVNLENYLGISFHLFDLPGYPASHSCVRLMVDDAKWIYDWCDTWKIDPQDRRRVLVEGTPVVVFGRFDYRKKPPWRLLPSDSTATDVPLHEIEAAIRVAAPLAVPDSLKRATLVGLEAKRDTLRPPARR